MAKVYAVRNISMCTKDCLCLYVCPTGSTDTEDSIIDKDKCIGCGACANACPSKAISLVPVSMPKQQKHDDKVIDALMLLFASKVNQEKVAHAMPNKLAKALEKSNRIMAEDIIREAGYMLPQSGNTKILLQDLLVKYSEFGDLIQKLLNKIQFNEVVEDKSSGKFKCGVCGYVHDGEMNSDFSCPICGQPSTEFTKI